MRSGLRIHHGATIMHAAYNFIFVAWDSSPEAEKYPSW